MSFFPPSAKKGMWFIFGAASEFCFVKVEIEWMNEANLEF
jgi:hypothetical protein